MRFPKFPKPNNPFATKDEPPIITLECQLLSSPPRLVNVPVPVGALGQNPWLGYVCFTS